MSARNGWQGDSIPSLRTSAADPETRIALDISHATFLPDPKGALTMIQERFAPRGPTPGAPRFLAYQMRDAVVIANFVTTALRRDLPTPDRRDTVAIWDKWRRAVLRVRPHLVGVSPTARYPDPYGLVYALESVAYDLDEALQKPGEVARRYCPWAADFFTPSRLYPEAD